MYLIEDGEDKAVVEEYKIQQGNVLVKNVVLMFPESHNFKKKDIKHNWNDVFDFFSLAHKTKITNIENIKALKILYGSDKKVKNEPN